MVKFWNKIKFWFWWNFKATNEEKAIQQVMVYGIGIMKNDKFVNLKEIYKQNEH